MRFFASPFPYSDPHMEMSPNGNVFLFGDFFLNPQMVTDTVWKWVSDWTVPICLIPVSIRGSPNGNREPYLFTLHMETVIVSIWGCVNPHFHMVIPVWKQEVLSFHSPYENGDYPFPNGDESIPLSIQGSPYGNGEPFISNPHMEMLIGHFHVGMYQSLFPYGDTHMEMGSHIF